MVLNHCRIFNWNSIDLKSVATSSCVALNAYKMPGAVQMTGTFKKVHSKLLRSDLPLKRAQTWSPSGSVHTEACRKTITSSCARVSIHHQRHRGYSGQGYCKDKRERFEYLEIKENLDSQAKIYASYSLKKTLWVWRMGPDSFMASELCLPAYQLKS